MYPRSVFLLLIGIAFFAMSAILNSQQVDTISKNRLSFKAAPNLPDDIGVAGPIVGVIDDSLIVAGGANFAAPDDPELWDLPKLYHKKSWILNRKQSEGQTTFQWQADSNFELSQRVAYASVVSTKFGVLCMGGEDETGPTNRAFLLSLKQDPGHPSNRTIVENDLAIPDLPIKCTAGGAGVVGNHVYLVAGQVEDEQGKKAASRIVYRLNLSKLDPSLDSNVNDQSDLWELVVSWPDEGPRRMFPLVTVQHDGFKNQLYVFGGRRFLDGTDTEDLNNLQATKDVWVFEPANFDSSKYDPVTGSYDGASPWKRLADAPTPLTAGTAVPYGPAHIIVPSAATMKIFHDVLDQGLEMRDFDHPGFPRQTYAYHTITDTWVPMGENFGTHVTTPAVGWGDEIFLVSGEIRPRVRTNKVWRIKVKENKKTFGTINMGVVVLYLLAMVGIGVFFTFRNKSTDDYFRGGKSIPWWAAGCSIFATMLSSITYMAVPAKAFAQDWVYWIGNFLILGIAPVAIYLALPFFRRLDATSAYEYLEKRFNRGARLIGSGSFSLFHIFRMGVVLALAALALASVTPLTPAQCVIVMGVLSIIYCTLGGVEAVIWTDTIQTFILLGGAVMCLCFAFWGSDPASFDAAVQAGKFHSVNMDFGSTSFMTMALWVVILGGIGQNLSSYTADQAVVQRYMTTENEKLAAKSIWLNAWLAIPASGVFFAMGTAFWMFYRSHPDKLDPTIAADRIMPLFISNELPVGLAGLVVAGIFAAAQSTVSTSMNSGATTIVTDFLRPLSLCKTDKGYLWVARFVTLAMGVVGTITGLYFVDPTIKSLFDQFIGILGMFLGVLAGLFALGATTRRATGAGSLFGAFVAILVMTSIVLAANDRDIFGINFRNMYDSFSSSIYQVNGYLYAFIGIAICYVVGFLASLVLPGKPKDLEGLVLWQKKKI